MKLLSAYVFSFGKLKDFSYDFTDGINTIKEDNGWGKSTFATFIKAMFYGLNDSKRNVAENERMKFKPWNSTERFGGNVRFQWGEKVFRLERFFGQKQAEDTVRLYDDITGKEYSNTENLGKRIFEIDEEGFLSTTYFSQKDFEIKSNSSLTAKFSSVCEIQDTDAFDKALLKVEEKAKSFKYRGDKGLIPDAKREIFAIDEKILKAENAVSTINNLKDEVAELSKEIERLEKLDKEYLVRYENAVKNESAKIKREQYQKLITQKEELNSTLISAKEILNGNSIDKEKVLLYQEKNKELVGLNAQIETIKSDIEVLNSALKKDNKTNKKPYLFIGLSGLFVIISVLLTFFVENKLHLLPVYLLTVILVVFTLIKFFNGKEKGSKNSNLVLILYDKTEKLKILSNEKITIEQEIDGYISLFNFGQKLDRDVALSNLIKIDEVIKDLNERIEKLNPEISLLAKEVKTQSEITAGDSVELLKRQRQMIASQIKQTLYALENKRSSIKLYEDLASSFPDLESKKAELQEKIADYEEEKNILDLTAKFLKQADENLKIKYKEPLQNSLNKYFSMISDVSKDVNIDVDFNVTVNEFGEQKSTDFYSKGYQNLFDICKRFALVDVLFTGEKPFIILDDPFYNLDDKKLSSAIKLLSALAKEYQILYLVCHESRTV